MKNYRDISSYNSISPTAGFLTKPKSAFVWNWLDAGADFVGKLGAGVLEFLLDSSEIKIFEKTDKEGNLIWEVWDRVKGDRSTFSSEAEVRAWLDERY
ncbi:MAG: hypothetical protein F6K35_34510 [Okeania sp. SIO2H7]|nr:hypothetical protein [Okeania sp. SIO2H7]